MLLIFYYTASQKIIYSVLSTFTSLANSPTSSPYSITLISLTLFTYLFAFLFIFLRSFALAPNGGCSQSSSRSGREMEYVLSSQQVQLSAAGAGVDRALQHTVTLLYTHVNNYSAVGEYCLSNLTYYLYICLPNMLSCWQQPDASIASALLAINATLRFHRSGTERTEIHQ